MKSFFSLLNRLLHGREQREAEFLGYEAYSTMQPLVTTQPRERGRDDAERRKAA